MRAGLEVERQLFYREAVEPHSPGLPLRLPWVAESDGSLNRNAVASAGRNPYRVEK